MANQEHIDQIFENVMTALQPAEELGGPLDALYVSLMERVAHETLRRADRVRVQMQPADGDCEMIRLPDGGTVGHCTCDVRRDHSGGAS